MQEKRDYFLWLAFFILLTFVGALYILQGDIASRFRFINHFVEIHPGPRFSLFDDLFYFVAPISWAILVILLNAGKAHFTSPTLDLRPLRVFLLIIALGSIPFSCVTLGLASDRTRWQLARVKSEVHTLSFAIKNFHFDHGHYPSWGTGAEAANASLHPHAPAFQIPTFQHYDAAKQKAILPSLTTPVAYLTDYAKDPFTVGRNRGATFYYYEDSNGLMLLSAGPDLDYDMKISDLMTTETMIHNAYDSTNGILSSGDAFRYQWKNSDKLIYSIPVGL